MGSYRVAKGIDFVENLRKGFAATGVQPLQPSAIDMHMRPSECFENVDEQDVEEEDTDEEPGNINHSKQGVQSLLETKVPEPHYFVESGNESTLRFADNSDTNSNYGAPTSGCCLFPFPHLQQPQHPQRQSGEPLIDYTKSILMTSDEYIAAMTKKSAKKERCSS